MEITHTLLGSQAYKDGYYAGYIGTSENNMVKDHCNGVIQYGKKHGNERAFEYGSYHDYRQGYADGVERKTRVINHLKQMSDKLREENTETRTQES